MSRIIYSSHNKAIIVDDEDYEMLSQRAWGHNSTGYARQTQTTIINGVRSSKTILMHRLLMNFPSKDKEVDHINRNKLDNRKCNLRVVTRQQNIANKTPSKPRKDKPTGKYKARLKMNYKMFDFGVMDSYELAYAHVIAASRFLRSETKAEALPNYNTLLGALNKRKLRYKMPKRIKSNIDEMIINLYDIYQNKA